ncbi:unnamed protein product, partial [Closterium sp. Naga37s-1]
PERERVSRAVASAKRANSGYHSGDGLVNRVPAGVLAVAPRVGSPLRFISPCCWLPHAQTAQNQQPGRWSHDSSEAGPVWHVVDYQQLLFHDCGDRVAQIVRLRSKGRLGGRPGREGSEGAEGEEEDVLVVNTHLLFPHDANSNIIRLCQVYKLLERVEQCRTEQAGRPAPVILCGDLNGTKEGNVYKLLRSQGFLSSYDTAHHLNDVDETWVSHRSHRGDVCGVDYVWMLNARTPMSNPVLNWRKAVFGLIKSKLLAAGITDARHAFQFFATAGDTSPFEHTVCFTSDPNATDAADVSMDFGQQQNDDPATEEQEVEEVEEDEEDEEAWRWVVGLGQVSPGKGNWARWVVGLGQVSPGKGNWARVGSDTDGDGWADFNEFHTCAKPTCFPALSFPTLPSVQLGLTGDNSIWLTEVEVAELMQGADTDGDGWLGLTGDNSIGLTEVEVAELMQGADIDGDGWVDFNEFQDMFQQPTWDSRVDTLKQSMAASLAASLAAASAAAAAAAAPGSAASPSVTAAAAGTAAVSVSAATSAASPSAASSPQQQKQQRWEEKEQAVLQGEQPYWESRRGLNVEGEAGQGTNRCRDASGAVGDADAGGAAVGGAAGVSVDAAGAGAAKEVTGGAASVQAGNEQVEECEIEGSDGGLSLAVVKASLFPPEMEEGRWPEDYTLSDHAVLTVMFGRERVDEVSK